jgi:tetratricopeptide (TPR) repeat protein
MELDDEIPELHYYRARYARLTDDLQDEITALRNARELYEEVSAQRPLDRFEVAREIDTYIREGEYLYQLEEVLSAETRFRTAIDLYERALDARKVEPIPMFGRAYAALGDIYYYEASDYDAAYQYYQDARRNRYGSPTEYPQLFAERQDLAYKMGFIELFRANSFEVDVRGGSVQISDQRDMALQQELLDRAITEFNRAQGAVPTANVNLLYARANTQYMRENYFDAASLYRILLDELTSERRSISTFLLEEDERHVALIDFQVRVNNNLGVTLYRLFQQGGENAQDLLAQSQLFLSRSTELSENLARDLETAVRADTRPLAFLNLNYILAPDFDDAVQIDPDIRKDLTAPTF